MEDFAPEYVAKTLMRAPKMIERYKKEQAKAHSAAAEVEKAGEQATFYQHQTKNLLEAEAQTAFQNVVKILGGFAALDDPREGAEALLKKYCCFRRRRLPASVSSLGYRTAEIASARFLSS